MVEEEYHALFKCPICRSSVYHVERIGSRGKTLQTLRPSPKTKEALKARRAADAQRSGDARADVEAAVEATAAVAVSAERDALRAVRANVNAAVGSKAAAEFLARELVGLADARPLRAALPVPATRLPHRLVVPLLSQVATLSGPGTSRIASALQRVQAIIPGVSTLRDAPPPPPPLQQQQQQRPHRHSGRASTVNVAAAVSEWPPEVDALVYVLQQYGALK